MDSLSYDESTRANIHFWEHPRISLRPSVYPPLIERDVPPAEGILQDVKSVTNGEGRMTNDEGRMTNDQ